MAFSLRQRHGGPERWTCHEAGWPAGAGAGRVPRFPGAARAGAGGIRTGQGGRHDLERVHGAAQNASPLGGQTEAGKWGRISGADGLPRGPQPQVIHALELRERGPGQRAEPTPGGDVARGACSTEDKLGMLRNDILSGILEKIKVHTRTRILLFQSVET